VWGEGYEKAEGERSTEPWTFFIFITVLSSPVYVHTDNCARKNRSLSSSRCELLVSNAQPLARNVFTLMIPCMVS